MRSPQGFAAAVVFLSAVPVILVYQAVVGVGVEAVAHATLALGSVLMAFAVLDFRTPTWMACVGCAATGSLAVIFLLQGASELIRNVSLTLFVYEFLGQRVEGWLLDLFLLWCLAVLLIDSRGKTRTIGFIAVSIAVCVEVYANSLSYAGSSLNAKSPALKLLVLLPFAWLLLESRKTAAPGGGHHSARSARAGSTPVARRAGR